MKTVRNTVTVIGGIILMIFTPFVVAGFEYGKPDFDYSDISFEHPDRSRSHKAVVTGAYRCPGDYPGFQHSIAFTASDIGHLNVETDFDNLDTGDCTPRGKDAMAVAQELGCTTGPLYSFRRGGGAGGAFGFICQGKRSHIIRVIQKLSKEILRPTQ